MDLLRDPRKIGIAREKKDVEFVIAKGQHITRGVGFAIVRVGKSFTIDEVVFGKMGNLLLLGARSLEGLNLAVDARRKKLVAAGRYSSLDPFIPARGEHA